MTANINKEYGPTHSLASSISKITNISVASLWIFQGLVPKAIFVNELELHFWRWLEMYAELAVRVSGIGEVIFGMIILLFPNKYVHLISILGLIGLLILTVIVMPSTLTQAFNPVVMNTAMLMLSVVWLMTNNHQKNN